MNNPARLTIHGSPQSQQSKRPINSISIETVESSIQNLVKSWNRRRKWKLLFNPREDHEGQNRAAWRIHLTNFLESAPLHVIAISLLLLDLVLTILELSSSLLSCSSEQNKVEKSWYHWAGIGILTLLSVKSIAQAVGAGGAFFRQPGYVVDGAVVIGALFLEAFLERKGGGLLVMVSLWRVVRVVESAFELSDEAIEAQVEGIVRQFEALREENRRLLETIHEKDDAIGKLEEIIEKLQEELNQRGQACND